MTWKEILKDSTLENTRGEPVDYSSEAMEARRKHGLAGVERKNKIIEQLRRKKEKGPLTQIDAQHLRGLENSTIHEEVRDAYLQGKNPDMERERRLQRERERKDILKDDIRRIKDKDRRRNPKEKDEVDIEPKEDTPISPTKPFNPFGPNASKRAKDSKARNAKIRRNKTKGKTMDIKPSRSKQLKDAQLRMAREKDSRR